MVTLRDLFEVMSFNEEDGIDYPFSEKIIINADLQEASNQVYEIQEWLANNVGYPPRWCLGKIRIDDESQIFQFLFKHPEDVVAFKLRWL